MVRFMKWGLKPEMMLRKGDFIHSGVILGYVVEFSMGICPSTNQEVEG